jgi:Leucine-rich repeat (LRR) protein
MCKYQSWGDRMKCEGNLKKIMRRRIFGELIRNHNTLEVCNTDLSHTEGSWFESKNNLKNLRINFNIFLRTLKNDSFVYFPRLRSLDVSHNQITSLSLLVLYPLKNLHILKLDHNKLQDLETGLFSSQRRLRSLSLSYNELQYLGNEILSPLKTLEYLDVNNNRLRTLDSKSFVSLQSMKFLNLSENYLNVLPENLFTYQQELRKLYIDRNNISVLTADLFSSTTEMEYLSFGGNQILKLNFDMLQSLVRLKRLDVVGCPIECDCSLIDFQQLCVARSITASITCKKGTMDYQVTFQNMSCKNLYKPTIILLAIVGISLFGMLANIFLGPFSKMGSLFGNRKQIISVHEYEYVENLPDEKGKIADGRPGHRYTPIFQMVVKVYDYLRPIQGRRLNIGFVNAKNTNSNPKIPETFAPFRPKTLLYDIPI